MLILLSHFSLFSFSKCSGEFYFAHFAATTTFIFTLLAADEDEQTKQKRRIYESCLRFPCRLIQTILRMRPSANRKSSRDFQKLFKGKLLRKRRKVGPAVAKRLEMWFAHRTIIFFLHIFMIRSYGVMRFRPMHKQVKKCSDSSVPFQNKYKRIFETPRNNTGLQPWFHEEWSRLLEIIFPGSRRDSLLPSRFFSLGFDDAVHLALYWFYIYMHTKMYGVSRNTRHSTW